MASHLIIEFRAFLALSFGASIFIFVVVDVVRRQRMAAVTMSLSAILASETIASKNIFARGHWFQMIGVNAIPNLAKVVQFKSIRNGRSKSLIDKLVRYSSFACDIPATISLFVCGTYPKPARRCFLNLFRNNLFYGIWWFHGATHTSREALC